MTLLQWLPLASVCLAGAMSPGPSLAIVVNASLGGGARAGLMASWSHAVGVGLYAALTVVGISALISASGRLFMGLQLAGAVYLLWMASKLWRGAKPASASDPVASVSAGAAARNGFLIAFLNPKLALFMLALFSQFVEADASLPTRLLLIATAFGIDGLWYSLVTLALSHSRWLAWLRRHAAYIDRTFAVVIGALALFILLRSVQGG